MKALSFLSKKFLIYAGIGIIAVLVIVFAFKNGNGKEIAVVTLSDLVQEVVATGKVKPNQTANLGFDRSGRVSSLHTFIGERVSQGKVLATLELDGVTADLDKAQAALKEEEIKLRETKNISPITYSDASKNLETAIREGFADADNAVRNKADQFFKNIPNNPQFEISLTSGGFVHYFDVATDVRLDLNNKRKNLENILLDWQKRMVNIDNTNLLAEADKAIADLNTTSVFLDKMAGAINAFISADYDYDTTVSNYKVAISGARSDISSAISSLVTAKDKFNTAPVLGETGQFGDVLIQESKVAQAKANVNSYVAVLEKSTIRAPFNGVVTLQDAKIGGTVSAGVTLMSVMSEDQMYIEANISEIHIGKIQTGNPVLITFDAFPGEEFWGQISYIEPGDVIVDGVVNYKVRVSFDNLDSKIKSGLTTNLKIQTAKKEKVLTVPLYAVIKEDDKIFVNKVIGKNVQKTPIVLGIVGNNGRVEVVEGLNADDVIEITK